MLRFFEYRNTYFFVFLGVSDAEFFVNFHHKIVCLK
jgi:hypothetical protein